jgi:hypothetical protein
VNPRTFVTGIYRWSAAVFTVLIITKEAAHE